MKKIAIFASGSGTNAQNIAEYFANDPMVSVSLILSNSPDAYVLERAEKLHIPAMVFNRSDLNEKGTVLQRLIEENINLIVLAGFLWLVPADILASYHDRIINIHPALLPKYGGKGMYGNRVHQAVYESGDKETGISIHYVNERYDEGKIIFQAFIEILPEDTPETIAQKVHKLEYEHYPEVIKGLLEKME